MANEGDTTWGPDGEAFVWQVQRDRVGQVIGGTWLRAAYLDRPDKASGYVAPRAPAAAPTYAPQYPTGGVTGTGQTYTRDPYTGQITLWSLMPELASEFGPQQQRDNTLADLASQRGFTAGENAATRTFNTGERVAGQVFSAGERLAGQDFAAGESSLLRAFNAGESALTRAFSGEEGYLDRTQRASQFLANYEISRAQEERASRDAALNAATTFTNLSASPDLGGYQRFLAAGGGSVGNAIQRGATSLTREGQLGAGRALQVAEQPVRSLPNYAYTPQRNPYAGATNPYAGQANQFAATTEGPVMTAAQQAEANRRAIEQPGLQARADAVAWANTPTESAATVWQPSDNAETLRQFNAIPRYAMGTQDMPVGFGTEFISGDDTNPVDPFASGADPEAVRINDPTGDATFSVDPLETPGAPEGGEFGPSEPKRMGALFHAIGDFLDGGEKPMGEFAPPPMMGDGMPPRFAYGTPDVSIQPMPFTQLGPQATAIQPSDNSYIDRVLAMRQATPYSLSTQAADYFNTSPTVRNINEMGAQVATGAPMGEFSWEAQRYRPGMLSRDSLSLGQ